jgi:hypothetical protein
MLVEGLHRADRAPRLRELPGPQVLDHVVPEVVAYRIGVPARRAQQPLYAVVCLLAQVPGHLPAGTALHWPQEFHQITPGPIAYLRPPESRRDSGMQPLQFLTYRSIERLLLRAQRCSRLSFMTYTTLYRAEVR